MAKKHHKSKTKVVYKNSPIPKEVDLTPAIREEIKALQEKKALIPKGFKGSLQKAQINKAIYDKSQYIRAKEGSRNLKEATIRLGNQIEFEKKRNELTELRKKNQVNFSGLGFEPKVQRKELKFEDLF